MARHRRAKSRGSSGVALVDTTRRERDAARQRLSKDRAENIIGNLCAMTRHAMQTGRILIPLAYEALFRRVIRSELCLQGWRWQSADETACDLITITLSMLQAKRPTWNEGQPEWTIERGTLIERTRCATCHKPLPEHHTKFCGKGCRNIHGLRLMKLREADEWQMATLASRSPL